MTPSNPKEAIERVRALRTWLAEKHAFAGRGELPADVAALDALIADRDGLAGEVERLTGQIANTQNAALDLKGRAEASELRLSALEGVCKEACDLLAERAHGSPARSPGHNARIRLESALASPASTVPVQEEGKVDGTGLLFHLKRAALELQGACAGDKWREHQTLADVRRALEILSLPQEQREATRELTVAQRVARIKNEAWPSYCNERRADDPTKAKNINSSREAVFEAGIRAAILSNDDGVRS